MTQGHGDRGLGGEDDGDEEQADGDRGHLTNRIKALTQPSQVFRKKIICQHILWTYNRECCPQHDVSSSAELMTN